MEIGTEGRDEQRWFLRASVSKAGVSESGATIGKLGIAGKPWAAPLDGTIRGADVDPPPDDALNGCRDVVLGVILGDQRSRRRHDAPPQS
jgi:hypothetical protein